MGTTLHTERLKLVTSNPVFSEAVLDYFKRNDSHLSPWMPTFPDDFYTAQFHANRLKFEGFEHTRGTKVSFYLFEKDDPGFEKVIGYISCSQIYKGAFHSGFLGYSIDENESGKGLLTEALSKVISYLFSEMNLHRVEANIIPRNAPSIRVVEKLGFIKEGYSKAYLRINGKWEDHIRFAMVNDQWRDI